MLELALPFVILAASIAYAAAQEYRNDNGRDAKLLGAFAGGSGLLGAALWLG